MHEHLKNSNISYFEHTKFALGAGIRLIWAGVASLLHAIHPSLFPGTAAKTVIDLYHNRLYNHPNSDYQEYIKHVSNSNKKTDESNTR